MVRQCRRAEQVIEKLRTEEIEFAKGQSVTEVTREFGITELT